MPDPTSWTISVLPQVAAALALLIAGAWIARWAERSLTRSLRCVLFGRPIILSQNGDSSNPQMA